VFFNGMMLDCKSSQVGGKPLINLSPYKATDTIVNNMVTNWASPSMKLVGDQLVTWRKEFENQPLQNRSYDPKDPKAKEYAFNEFVRVRVKILKVFQSSSHSH
jgi:hypothetical protein